jgi:hypothetical protein
LLRCDRPTSGGDTRGDSAAVWTGLDCAGTPMPDKKLARRVTIAVTLFVLALLVLCVGLRLGRDGIKPMPFDSGVWKANPSECSHASVRLRMVDDLLRTEHLQGRSREEVVDLLGEPDDTEYFRDYDMVYRLGLERGWICIDSEWLVLATDENDRVREACLVRD